MGIIINQSIRNAIISYTGIALGFIATIVLAPHILGAERFGLTRTLIAVMTISAQFVNLGVSNAIIKFFPFLQEKTESPQGLFWVFTIPPLLGLLVFSVVYIFMQESILSLYADDTLFAEYYYLIIPMVFSLAAFGLLNSFVKASFNTVFASFLQEVLLRILFIADLILFYFGYVNFDEFILIFVLNYGIQYLLLFFYALKGGYLNFSFPSKVFNKTTRKAISQFSFFSFFSGFTMILVGNIDLIMVDIFEGLEKTGVYAIALYFGAVIVIARRSISKISFPIITKAFKDDDMKMVDKVYRQSALNQLLVGLLIYIGILANTDNLFSLLPEIYAQGSMVIVIIGLANLFDIATGANGQIIIASKYYKFDFISSFILMAVSIVLNLILIPKFGMTGAATATAASICIYNIIKMMYVWFKFKLQPFTWQTLALIVLGPLVLYASKFMPSLSNVILDILLRSILITIAYVGSVYLFNLSDEVNDTLRAIFKKIRASLLPKH